ncbi:MAG: gliding motility protein GldL [Bacteroidetes bacterium]|nr:gliding motility protein GldL [Bacteroidota bacterium]
MLRKLEIFFESTAGKRTANTIIGVGAAVVMMGALFKLEHWSGASIMLTAGLTVEAFIFSLLGILPPHKDYYWEKMYPNLDIAVSEEEARGEKGTAIEQLEKALKGGELGPEVIDSLGNNLRSLGDNISKLSDLTDASIATDEYAENAKAASVALTEMKSAYGRATEAVTALTAVSESADDYRDQMSAMAKNVGALNELYELELSETSNNRQTIGKFYDSMQNLIDNLEGSVENTQKYKEEVAGLAENIAQLNSVYGNMLSAMNTNAR